MAEKVSKKENAVALLDKQLALRAKKNQFGIIVMSSATDPYLQMEKTEMLTRSLLEIICKHRFPLHLITKSDLITRDFDLLHDIEKNAILPEELQTQLKRKLFISFSFSTIDDNIASIFEPGATPPSIRLETLSKTLEAGFHSGASLMPLLPYISDTGEHLEKMFSTFSRLGIKYIFPSSITLFGNEKADSKTLVFRAVEKHYPHLLEKYQRFFQHSTSMPAYYSSAFSKKMKSLIDQYDLHGSILDSFNKKKK